MPVDFMKVLLYVASMIWWVSAALIYFSGVHFLMGPDWAARVAFDIMYVSYV